MRTRLARQRHAAALRAALEHWIPRRQVRPAVRRALHLPGHPPAPRGRPAGRLRPAQRCALAGLGTAGRACRGRRPAGPWPVPGRGVPRHRARHVGRPDLPVGRPATAGYRGPGRRLARRAGQPPAMAGTGARPGWRSPGGARPHPRWRRRPGLGRGAGGAGGDHLRHAVPEALLRRHGPAHRRRRPVPGQRRLLGLAALLSKAARCSGARRSC